MVRASDRDRDRVVRLLRDCVADGRLSHDSFVRRLDLALEARTRSVLDELVADLRERREHALAPLRDAWGAFAAMLNPAAAAGRLPALVLPGRHQPVLVIGRSRQCDVTVPDPTVSRVHACVRLFGDDWFIDDLGSTNGTWVNGVRVRAGTSVASGDRLRFGRSTFLVRAGSGRAVAG